MSSSGKGKQNTKNLNVTITQRNGKAKSSNKQGKAKPKNTPNKKKTSQAKSPKPKSKASASEPTGPGTGFAEASNYNPMPVNSKVNLGVKDPQVSEALTTVPIICTLDLTVIPAVAAAFVIAALARGCVTEGGKAAGTIYTIGYDLIGACIGMKSIFSVAPRAYWELRDGLAPCVSGGYSFTWSPPTTWIESNVPNASIPATFPTGKLDTSVVASTAGLLPAYEGNYTGTWGSFSSDLWVAETMSVFACLGDKDNKATLLVPYSKSDYIDDPSAFAAGYLRQGGADNMDVSFGSLCYEVGLEVPITSRWLADLNLTNSSTTDLGTSRRGEFRQARHSSTTAAIGHRLFQGYVGKQGANDIVKFKFVDVGAMIRDYYNVIAKVAKTQIAQDVNSASTVPFSGVWGTQFSLVTYMAIMQFFKRWGCVVAFQMPILGTQLTGGVFTNINIDMELFNTLGAPAWTVESLRALAPIRYEPANGKPRQYTYSVPFIESNFQSVFDALCLANNGSSLSTIPFKGGAPNSAQGGPYLELTTGVVSGIGISTSHILTGTAVQTVVTVIALEIAKCNPNVAIYPTVPTIDKVENTQMNYTMVVSNGAIGPTLFTRSGKCLPIPERLLKAKLMRRYLKGMEVKGEVPDPLKVEFLRMIDRKNGIVDDTDFNFVRREPPPPSGKYQMPVPPPFTATRPSPFAGVDVTAFSTMSLVLNSVLSKLPFSNQNFAFDSRMFQPIQFSPDQDCADIIPYADSLYIKTPSDGVNTLVESQNLAHHMDQVHPAASDNNTEFGDILENRLALGMGGGANPESFMNMMASGMSMATKLIPMFL